MFVRRLARLTMSKSTLAIICVAFGLATTTTAALLLVSSPPKAPTQPQPRPSINSPVVDETAQSGGKVSRTADPETFATSVAATLFEWDTAQSTPLNVYTGRLMAVAEPTGEESAGLVTDLTMYLPSPESWADLKTYRTRQWLDITSYEVPEGWRSAELNGEAADQPDGTTAITVTGLRRRSGVWQGEPAQTVDKVSFTIFMTCMPTYGTCRLLRLSQLNNPLH